MNFKNVNSLQVRDKVHCNKTNKKSKIVCLSNGMYVGSRMIKLSNREEFSMMKNVLVYIYK